MDPIRPWLFIGNYRDALNKRFLELNSILALLHLADVVEHPDIDVLCLPVEDMETIPPSMIRKGIEFIRTHANQKHHILITCGAGINRSTAYCIVALKEIEGVGLFEAYKDVKKRHYDALPNRLIWESLCEYYKESVPYLDIMKEAARN